MVNFSNQPNIKFVIGANDPFKFVRLTPGDHRILKYMANKEKKSLTQMLHELFLQGIKCKLEQHEQRMRRLGLTL